MVSEGEVMEALNRAYRGKPVTLGTLRRELKVEGDEIRTVLRELEERGLIRVERNGRTSGYVPQPKITVEGLYKELSEVREEMRKVWEVVRGRSFEPKKFDEVYSKVKDSLGYARLSDIRVEMGLSREEFYSKLEEHLEGKYDLIAGGEEGLVRKGSVYGIVKRRGKS